MNFYNSSLFAYNQTDYFLYQWRKNKAELTSLEIEVNPPKFYKSKIKGEVSENQKNLSEVIFVRLVSALEVYLIDQVREIFITNKEPFKKEHIKLEFNQKDLLSLKSHGEIFDKVIAKDLRRLSSGGFGEIIKYYKSTFKINLEKIPPGKNIMTEYHQRRHLLVHRLGKTDQFYREKFNNNVPLITIEQFYLETCFKDFEEFVKEVFTQVEKGLAENFAIDSEKVKSEAKGIIEVEFSRKTTPIFEPNFDFWAGESYCMFNTIFDRKVRNDISKYTYYISGTTMQILTFKDIVEAEVKRGKFKAEIQTKISSHKNYSSKERLTETVIERIKQSLPEQPWIKNQHKRTATQLGVSNILVSKVITILIDRGDFKNQRNGKLLD